MTGAIRTAIVGCGKVAHIHAQALQALPESEFVAVSGEFLDPARVFAAQYGVRAYTDTQEMIRKEHIGAICICTPHLLHARFAIMAAELGVHVLVEKPMAVTLAHCDAMLAAAAKTGVKLGVISQRRLYRPVQRMKQAIDAGKIGSPVLGSIQLLGWRDEQYYQSDPWRGTWEGEGGGILVNQAPHLLDLLQWFMGPVDELFGYWDNLNHPTIEVEDTAIAVLRFKSGALGTILASNSQKPGIYGKIHIHGKNGASVGAQTDGGAMFIAGMSAVEEPALNDVWTIPGEQSHLARWEKEDGEFFKEINPESYYHRLQIQDFLQSALQGREPMIPGEQGRRTVELFTALYASQKTHKPVRFPL